jgi:D-lyxose ketol-isomerase
MKRSFINAQIDQAIALFEKFRVCLPPFATFTPADWAVTGSEYDEIRENMLGWDVTTFGRTDFFETGLLLFTLRNGNLKTGDPKPYAEKMMVVRENQVTPFHYHWNKMEDIINRGGGNLLITLYNADENDRFAQTDVTVRSDGRRYTIAAGDTVTLKPGMSITLSPKQYHTFKGEPGRGVVLVGEVSQTNDDTADNRFYEPCGRFNEIEEDESAKYLLCNEIP